MACDFELQIVATGEPGLYDVTAESPAGTALGRARIDAGELYRRRPELETSVIASAASIRGGRIPALERPLREVGQQLFDGVFTDRVYGRYTASLQEAARLGEPLRLVLRLRAAELAGLPWEALFDREAGEYLCQREPVVRYVDAPHAVSPLAVKPPLRILGIVASPHDLPRLDVEEEKRRVNQAVADLSSRGLVEVVWAEDGTWASLQGRLQEQPWNVVHFVGHGGVDAHGSGILWLEDNQRKASSVSAVRFARLLHTARPAPRLVILNSCQSGESAADDLLSSTAAALVSYEISAAVAMQFAVTDPAALAFSQGFYGALGKGIPVDEAVRSGRIAIDGTGEQTLEWVTPVLYLRTADTRLFDVALDQAPPPPRYPPPPPGDPGHQDKRDLDATLYGLYARAIQAAEAERFEEAVGLFDRLLEKSPEYRDAPARREAARKAAYLAGHYQRARAAQAMGDWDTAIQAYTEILRVDSRYRDASARRRECKRNRKHPPAPVNVQYRNPPRSGAGPRTGKPKRGKRVAWIGGSLCLAVVAGGALTAVLSNSKSPSTTPPPQTSASGTSVPRRFESPSTALSFTIPYTTNGLLAHLPAVVRDAGCSAGGANFHQPGLRCPVNSPGILALGDRIYYYDLYASSQSMTTAFDAMVSGQSRPAGTDCLLGNGTALGTYTDGLHHGQIYCEPSSNGTGEIMWSDAATHVVGWETISWNGQSYAEAVQAWKLAVLVQP